MKALITGSGGFVGGYLRDELETNRYEVIGLDIIATKHSIVADLLDKDSIVEILKKEQPDVVFHLAGQASVARSWDIPQQTIEINVIAALNLFEAMLSACPNAKLLLVGSSDQYGNVGDKGTLISEELALNPQTPYAVSKQAQENLAGIYARSRGLKVCMTRSFNHGGAGQREGFLISDFSSGAAKVEAGIQDKLFVGNLEAQRDFTHVKDVVAAYRLIAEKGKIGEVYNVGSGSIHSANDILNRLLSMASCPIIVEQHPDKMRPSDTPVMRCDNTKLVTDTGWSKTLDIDDMLKDSLEYYRSILR